MTGFSLLLLTLLVACGDDERPQVDPPLEVIEVVPVDGPAAGGITLVIKGQSIREGAAVTIQGSDAEVVSSAAPNAVVVLLPAGHAGAADVTVTNPNGVEHTLEGGFVYKPSPTPKPLGLHRAVPGSGQTAGGEPVAVFGVGLVEGARVSFGAVPALSTEFISETLLLATTPPSAAGAAALSVENPDGASAILEDPFVFVDSGGGSGFDPKVLTLSDVFPGTGNTEGGTEVALVGSSFNGDLEVTFGGIAATSVSVVSPYVALAVAPPAEAGSVSVSVARPGAESATLVNAFRYVDNSLAVTAITPSVGPASGGTEVAVIGRGFVTGLQVQIGGRDASEVHVLSSATATLRTPPGELGVWDVVVTIPGQDPVQLDEAFTYSRDASAALGEIPGLVPNRGPTTGGTTVAIRGVDLRHTTAVRVAGAQAQALTLVSDSLILCSTPAGAPGPADVALTMEDGSERVRANGFFYFDPDSRLDAPVIKGVFPTSGPLAGGSPFILDGAHFAEGARVFFGQVEVDEVRRGGPGVLTGRAPAGLSVGPTDVTVVHPDGHSATLVAGFVYYDAMGQGGDGPRLDSVQPPTASTLGGSVVVGNGDGFHGDMRVLVDELPSSLVQVTGAGRATFVAPAHPEGSVRVTVVNPDGKYFDLEGGLNYQAEPPTLDEVVPSEGPVAGFGGMMLRGAGFDPQAEVTVGGHVALEVVVLDPGTLLAVAPPGELGPADVTVTQGSGLSATLSGGYTYTDDTMAETGPSLTAIRPFRGPNTGGTVARISGDHLRSGATLWFGPNRATLVKTIGETVATVVVPAGQVGPVDLVWVAASGQVSVLRDGFEYTEDTGVGPTVAGLSPNRGSDAGGTPVVIAGESFSFDSEVFFDLVPADAVAVTSEAFITTETPGHLPGPVDVTVSSFDGHSTTLVAGYTYVASPVVLGVQPPVGHVAGGTPIQIGGTGFGAGAVVTLGGVTCIDLEVLSDSLITCQTPPGSVGTVDVAVRNTDGQVGILADGFDYLLAPELHDIWPGSGPASGGTRALIRGAGLRAGAIVMFGDQPATAVAVSSDGLASAIVPAGTVGLVAVTWRNLDGQEATAVDAFTYVDPTSLGSAPSLTGCFPSVGGPEGGTSVRLDGADFMPDAVAFFDGQPAPSATVSDTVLAATAPPHPVGRVPVAVTNPDGQTAALTDCFEYTTALGTEPAPLVSVVQPNLGPTSGGTEIVVNGDHFQVDALVLVGGRLASSINRVDAQRIEAITPPGSLGAATVAVTNPDGKVGVLPDGFTYLAPPSVTAVDPAEGPSTGGTELVVTGTGFQQGAQLRVQSNLATDILVLSDTEIRAVTPAGTPGVASVTVVNPDGQLGSLAAGFAYTPPPVIDHVDPTSGSTEGDTWVHVFGSGFRGGAQVDFGVAAAQDVQVLSGSELRALTPAAPAGQVAVTVTNVDGFSDTLPGAFTYLSPPRIDSVAPNSGPEAGGTVVTVLGAFFDADAQVFFGGDEASVTFLSAAVLEATSPPRPAGPAAVSVRNPDGQQVTVPGAFVYFPPIPPPTVDAISPSFGPLNGGTLATVSGSDFQFGARVFVGLNEVAAASVEVLSAQLIRVRVPAGTAVGTVDVRVLNPGGLEDTLPAAFNYLPALALPPVALSSITPNRSGLEGGVTATVLGNGLASDVMFSAVKGAIEVPIPITQYFGPTAVQVTLPEVPEAGGYDLRAVIPSSGDETVLGQAIDYRDFRLMFAMRRGRTPNEVRPNDGQVVVTDLDQDGFKDAFILRGIYRSSIYLNRGTAQPGFFDDVTNANLDGEGSSDSDRHNSYSYTDPMAADFTQDGFPDILARAGDSFRLWESLGFGRLHYGALATRPSGASTVRDWAIADIDGQDGLDIYVSTAAKNYWLRNRGVERDAGGDPVLDGDGRPNWLGFDTVLFAAVVQGNSQEPSESSYGCDIGDADGDGDNDIVVANGNNVSNRLYINDGGDPPAFIDVSNSPQFNFAGDTRSARFVDFDQDGHLDVAMANLNQDDVMAHNDGAGNFTNNAARLCHNDACTLAGSAQPFLSPTVAISAGADRYGWVSGDPTGPDRWLDIDRDGCTDLMVRFDGDRWLPRFYLQQKVGPAPLGCTGQFYYTSTETVADPTNPIEGLYQGAEGSEMRGIFGHDLRTNDGDRYAQLADLDNDGWLDMFQTHPNNIERVYLREPIADADSGQTVMRLIDRTLTGILPRDLDFCSRAEATDINGDGAPDLVVANYGSDCYDTPRRVVNRILINDGAGNFFDGNARWSPSESRSEDVIIADMNGDGADDILEINRGYCSCSAKYDDHIKLYQNDGNGYFTDVSALTNLGDVGCNSAWTGAKAVDVDSDGDLDLVAYGDRSYLRALYLNGGDPLNQGAPYFFRQPDADLPDFTATNVSVLDFNLDGALDLYLARNGQNQLLQNDGLGSFSTVTGLYINAINDNSVVALVDAFAGGPRSDIFVVNMAQQRRIHVADGDDTFGDETGTNIVFSDNRQSDYGRSIDIDMDGLPDVIMPARNTQNILYLNVGNAVFQDWSGQVFPNIGEDTRDIAVADFDGDGDEDAFVCNWGQQNKLLINRLIDN